MIKLTYCLWRKPGMSVHEFQRYWHDTHAPLIDLASSPMWVGDDNIVLA